MSRELEYYICRACCMSGRAAEVMAKLSPDDFSPEVRPFMESAKALFDRGTDPDVVTVAEDMEANGWDQAGQWISHLSNLEYYHDGDLDSQCKELKRYSLRRKIQSLSIQMSQWAQEEEPESAYEMACAALMDVNQGQAEDSLMSMKDMVRECLEDLDRRNDAEESFEGLATGFQELDRRWQGMKPHNLIVIAGRPGMGKTTLAMNIVEHSIKQGKTWLFFSMEMSHAELAQKMISSSGKVSFTRLGKGKLNDGDWPRLTGGVSSLKDCQLFVDDRGGVSLAELRGRCHEVKRKHGLDGVVVDYLQLMRGEGQNREAEIGGLSRGLKQVAKEMEVPIIVISQLNRQCEQRPNKRPILSDLRDSGSIEQDANLVAFVYRDEVYNEDTTQPGMAEIITRKFRGGKTGTDCLKWIGDNQKFDDLDFVPDIDALIESSESKKPSWAF